MKSVNNSTSVKIFENFKRNFKVELIVDQSMYVNTEMENIYAE